ncbi:hypothetical protein GCM10010140_62480 [Streptosporangium pseudovulgare]|uniref:DNA-binding protein n=1 Tax=Streptosporangium pseudovulgare TaxID=35765 RepID=A0ABQ2RE50_9ACTN|nr:hypothetical protein GCM10010140_62480 [Streptosporangium pseudovulgare]
MTRATVSSLTRSESTTPGTKGMSLAELLALPAAVDLVTAGRAWGLGRTKSHDLARAGEFPCPVLRLGNAYRVTRADLLRSLGIDPLQVDTSRSPALEGGPDAAA